MPLSSIQPKAGNPDFSTHAVPRNFRKSSHHVNTNKGSVVKQYGTDGERYRSQKILFQPNVRVILQYSVNWDALLFDYFGEAIRFYVKLA